MKIRESGMPREPVWDAYFDPDRILRELGLTPSCRYVVEFGCGYGTFTVPAARLAAGTVYGLDIEPSMIQTASRRAAGSGMTNIVFAVRDFMTEGSGLPDQSVDYAILFNILHNEEPVRLLREAYRNLRDGGLAGIIHWNYDPETPRGPPMAIRPRPEQCRQWARDSGFLDTGETIDLPPYHYGLTVSRPEKGGSDHFKENTFKVI
jgi:SAM-dependent methyltransferase